MAVPLPVPLFRPAAEQLTITTSRTAWSTLLGLLSASDIAAGAIAQRLTSIGILGQQNAQIKEGGELVLRWLYHNSITLKKFEMTVKRLPNGEVDFGSLDSKPGSRWRMSCSFPRSWFFDHISH